MVRRAYVQPSLFNVFCPACKSFIRGPYGNGHQADMAAEEHNRERHGDGSLVDHDPWLLHRFKYA